MSVIDDLKPTEKHRIIDLLNEAGFDVSDWADFRGPHAASNPKSYNWSFEQSGEKVALCLWHRLIKSNGREIHYHATTFSHKGPALKRARDVRQHVRIAYEMQLPIRVIVVDATYTPGVTAKVEGRLLDAEPWAVKEFDIDTGEWLLVRGKEPFVPAFYPPDIEVSYFEGAQRPKFILHRRREAQLRRAKIAEVMAEKGKLVCEVPNCDFDFKERYGDLGDGYVQVHHKIPLNKAPKEGRKIFLKDVAVVCANCHAMIHRFGKCRPLEGLLPA